jgi:hypothetical protein
MLLIAENTHLKATGTAEKLFSSVPIAMVVVSLKNAYSLCIMIQERQ